MKENRLLFYIMISTWGILYTMVSALILLFVLTFLRNKILYYKLVEGRLCVVFKTPYLGGASFSFWYMMGSTTDLFVKIHKHELGHTKQNQWWGPLMLYVALHSVIRAGLWETHQRQYFKVHGRYDDYYGIWFERTANTYGGIFLNDIT